MAKCPDCKQRVSADVGKPVGQHQRPGAVLGCRQACGLMAFPDDDHIPVAILDDSGEVVAIAHCAPDISDEGRRALADVIAAARRLHEADPDRAEKDARQEASRRRIRERNARLRGNV